MRMINRNIYAARIYAYQMIDFCLQRTLGGRFCLASWKTCWAGNHSSIQRSKYGKRFCWWCHSGLVTFKEGGENH